MLCLLAVLGGGAAAGEHDGNGRCEGGVWEVVFEQGDLQVSRRDYAGSALDEVQGVVRVKASLNALMALLKDADFNREWVYRSGGARILQTAGYARAWVYGIVDAPIPMDDRDTVVRFDYRQDAATRIITIAITNTPDFVPAVRGLVRVPDMGGCWRLQPEAGGWVRVTYRIHGDPGGWIPAWLANRAAQQSVRYTLARLPSVVARYAGATSASVLEVDQPPAR